MSRQARLRNDGSARSPAERPDSSNFVGEGATELLNMVMKFDAMQPLKGGRIKRTFSGKDNDYKVTIIIEGGGETQGEQWKADLYTKFGMVIVKPSPDIITAWETAIKEQKEEEEGTETPVDEQ